MIIPKSFVAVAAALFFAPSIAGDAKTRTRLEGLLDSNGWPVQTDDIGGTLVANTYIVQLKHDVTQSDIDIHKRSLNSHAEFEQLSKRADLVYSTRQVYASPSVFVGLSLTLDNNADLKALKDLDNVLDVWPVYNRTRPLAAIPFQDISQSKTRDVVPGTNVTMAYITGNIDVNRPHAMAKVDEVHKLGIKGKGIKIAVIDQGVDFRHPSLGGCFGPGCKIAFGYDFIENKADPGITCLTGGHGTHTTGIIGMEDLPGQGFGLVGVAPEATLMHYRIFDCPGYTSDDIVIAAMLLAAADGADVLSMSFGLITSSAARDPYNAVTTALAAQGVAMFAAAGNGGDTGIYSTQSPGIGAGVFSVGSTDNSKFPITYQLKDSNGRSLRYSSILPLDSPEEGLMVQVVNFGADAFDLRACYTEDYDDAVANLTARGIDPANVVLAVLNGGCSVVAKGRQARIMGYKYMISYTTSDQSRGLQAYEMVYPGYDYGINPVQLNPQDSTTFLSSYAKEGLEYKVYFDGTNYDAGSPSIVTGGLMSNFSTFGPLDNLNLKPQASAPGARILSTWPLGINSGYAVLSGTSMATPFMAGVYALIKSQKPDMSALDIYALMQNSADKQLSWIENPEILSSTVHQGAGSVNIVQALKWESLVTPPQLNLGFSNTTVTTNFTITNRSDRSKTYTFSHQGAGGMAIPDKDYYQHTMMYPWYASAKFEFESIKIKGGESATVKAYITVPPGSFTYRFWPIYTGFITVHNNYETYTIPYVGSPFVYPF